MKDWEGYGWTWAELRQRGQAERDTGQAQNTVFTDCGMSLTRRVTGAAEGQGQRGPLSWGVIAGLSHVSNFSSLFPWEILSGTQTISYRILKRHRKALQPFLVLG